MRFATPDVRMERRSDGSIILRAAQPLLPYGRVIGDWLVRWAREAPDRRFLAERDGDGWRAVTYAEAYEQVRRIGEALLARGLTADTPVAILSGNSIRHALVSLGAMHAGLPIAPISPAYSLVSTDFAKLRAVAGVLRPGLVFAEPIDRFVPALAAIGQTAVAFDELIAHASSARIDEAFAAVTPEAIAKILFTSGSTGTPKGAINTHRSLCASQQSMAQLWLFLAETPPVMCDWLPWHHTVGGNAGFNMVLRNGGTLYIDDGRPVAGDVDASPRMRPGSIDVTVRNLTEVAPTVSFNVPRGYELLVPRLESDPALRRAFFSRLEMIYYTGAALPAGLWHRLKGLAAQEGASTAITAGWGSTEMTLGTRVHYDTSGPENVGTPGPGVELKLVPSGGKLEARVRGPNVMPGYYRAPELTRDVFDEEGFLKSGDALALADPDGPSNGLVFDGRLAENFKLSSGTWVNVGAVRLHVIATCQPLVQDAVITGHDRDELGALVFLNQEAVSQLRLDTAGVRAHLSAALKTMQSHATGSASTPTRLRILDEPPSLDAGEITDKGYINQRAVLERRQSTVADLYAGTAETITIR